MCIHIGLNSGKGMVILPEQKGNPFPLTAPCSLGKGHHGFEPNKICWTNIPKLEKDIKITITN